MKTIKFDEEIHDESLRCKSTTTRGACQHLAVEDTERCPHHGANKVIQKNKNNELKNYNLTKFKARIADKSESENIKSLKEEVGILRQLLETVWNSCEQENDLIVNSAVIADLAVKVQKCIAEMTKIDVLNDRMIEKDEIAKFGVTIINIVSQFVEDKDLLTKIADEMIKALDSVE